MVELEDGAATVEIIGGTTGQFIQEEQAVTAAMAATGVPVAVAVVCTSPTVLYNSRTAP